MKSSVEVNNGNGTVYMKVGVKGLAALILAYIVAGIIWGATLTAKVNAIEKAISSHDTMGIEELREIKQRLRAVERHVASDEAHDKANGGGEQ